MKVCRLLHNMSINQSVTMMSEFCSYFVHKVSCLMTIMQKNPFQRNVFNYGSTNLSNLISSLALSIYLCTLKKIVTFLVNRLIFPLPLSLNRSIQFSFLCIQYPNLMRSPLSLLRIIPMEMDLGCC